MQQLLPKDKRTSSEFPKRGRNSVTELVEIKTHQINIMEIIAKDGIVIQNIMHFFFLNNFIYKTITYTTYSINYTYIVLATYTTDTYTYTNYAYTTLRYMYYNTININLIYGWRVYKVLFN